MAEDVYKASLRYHTLGGRPGKLEVVPTKPCTTQRDLSLAYSPGVAEPCRRIADNQDDAYRYTNKGNLVAVISNGTAVLGLGDIGPAASKPVMEGKAVLFKRFADVDVFDIEVGTKDPEEFIRAVEAIAPTFGGINLEDISGRHCFYIEQELQRRLDIPVFHDDQHGTAIIAAAAMLNACELTDRQPEDLRCVFNGAGAAGISVARLFVRLGVRRENIIMCDSKGVIHTERDGLDEQKSQFAVKTDARTLEDAVKDQDCFIGLSIGNVMSPEMLRTMAKDPIVFAMANPTPEIDFPLAKQTRSDVIMATGRSDYPNQVNNVLGFPFIFRGALDTASRMINEEMKLAAVRSLAALAKESVPETVSRAYGGQIFEFGRDYLIPKPFDPRVLYRESVAVAEAAIETGVARNVLDIDKYRESLRQKVDQGRSLVQVPLALAKNKQVRIAMPEGHLPKIATVAQHGIDEGIAHPVLVGPGAKIREAMADAPAGSYDVVDPEEGEHVAELIAVMKRQRPFDETLNEQECRRLLKDPYVYATLLCEAGYSDGLLAAGDRPYREMVRPIVTFASRRRGVSRIGGLHMLALKDRHLFIADTALIPDPSAEELAEIALRATRVVRRLNIVPRVAFVSFENFSRRDDTDISKMRRAFRIVRQADPTLEVFGDVQADLALEPERFRGIFGSRIPEQPANILLFPNLHAANAAYRIARVLGQGTAIGPNLLGLRRPSNVMPSGSTEDEIIDMLAITAFNAWRLKEHYKSHPAE